MQPFNQLGFWHMALPERLTALRKEHGLTQALRVSAAALVFDAVERGPNDDMKFQFEAVARMHKKEREAIRTMLATMIVRNQVAGVLEGVAKAASR